MNMHIHLLWQSVVLAQYSGQLSANPADSELFGVNTQGLIGLGIAAVVITVVLAAVYFFKSRARPPVNDSLQLFRDFCDAHQLGRRNRELLLRFARDWKISNPCLLFLNISLWQTGQLQIAQGKRPHSEQQKVDRLKKTVFALAKSKPTAR